LVGALVEALTGLMEGLELGALEGALVGALVGGGGLEIVIDATAGFEARLIATTVTTKSYPPEA